MTEAMLPEPDDAIQNQNLKSISEAIRTFKTKFIEPIAIMMNRKFHDDTTKMFEGIRSKPWFSDCEILTTKILGMKVIIDDSIPDFQIITKDKWHEQISRLK